MGTRKKKWKFTLEEIDAFDARRGYKRCSLPGVGTVLNAPPHAPWLRPTYLTTDFWRDRTGKLVVRFSSSNPWMFSFEASLANGKPIRESDLEEFGWYITEMLLEWEGTDDSPVPEPWI